MRESKTICTEVEGLLPLYVGGDLEKDQLEFVGKHMEECSPCAKSYSRTREARGLLRAELLDLVDGREPQLWPALREQLQAEGLFKQAVQRTHGVSEGSSSAPFQGDEPVFPGEQRSVASLSSGARPASSIYMTPRLVRRVASLAAGVAAIFLLSDVIPFRNGVVQPEGTNGDALVSQPAEDTPSGSRDGGSLRVSEGMPADSLANSTGTDAAPGSNGTGLRPVGFAGRFPANIDLEGEIREGSLGSGQMLVPTIPWIQFGSARDDVGLANHFPIQ